MIKRSPGNVERGRAAVAARAWEDAFHALEAAHREGLLDNAGMEQLVLSAGLTGRDGELVGLLEELHRRYMQAGDCRAAARAAFWLCMRLNGLGESGKANGWLTRAQRILEQDGSDCVEKGFLLLPVANRSLMTGDLETAIATSETASAIGERFGEPDLVALARGVLGRALVRQGRAVGLHPAVHVLVGTVAHLVEMHIVDIDPMHRRFSFRKDLEDALRQTADWR